jgi:hypothetical protein
VENEPETWRMVGNKGCGKRSPLVQAAATPG